MSRRAVATAVLLFLALGAGFVLSGPASADPQAVRFDRKRVEVQEHQDRVMLTVSRSTAAALEETRVYWETEDRDATDLDYYAGRGWIELGVGDTYGSISVQIFDDLDYEPDPETFRVRLYPEAGAHQDIDDAIVVIQDDDHPFNPEDVETFEAAGAPTTPAPAPRQPSAPAGAPSAADQPTAGAANTASASRPSTRPSARAARQPAKPRVTPFHLQSPADDPASTPQPGPPSPVTAAGVLGALVLARVAAEFWYRWRVAAL